MFTRGECILPLLDTCHITQDEIKSFKLEYMSALGPNALHISVNPLIFLCSTPSSFPYSRLTEDAGISTEWLFNPRTR